MLATIGRIFLVLVRLRLGLFERDLVDCFGTSVSTVSRVYITWLNFLHLKLKELPLWPGRDLVKSYMPQVFKDLYPDTRVIIDATEIFIEAPALPELQQMTFHHTKTAICSRASWEYFQVVQLLLFQVCFLGLLQINS